MSSLRRSTISACAPAGSANRNSGRPVAALTSDTISGDGSRVVISHAVATLAIQPPMLEIRTAIQTIRKAGTARGLQAAATTLDSWGLVSVTAHPNSLMAVVCVP